MDFDKFRKQVKRAASDSLALNKQMIDNNLNTAEQVIANVAACRELEGSDPALALVEAMNIVVPFSNDQTQESKQ